MVSNENADQLSPLMSQTSLNDSLKKGGEKINVNSQETMERLRTQNFGALR